ncbi:MAG: penicillin-binding protein 1C [Verrucomicrobiota bacterium]
MGGDDGHAPQDAMRAAAAPERLPSILHMKLPSIDCRRLARRALLVGGLGLLAWFALPFAVPLPPGLLEPAPASPVLLDRHGEPLEHLALADSTRAAPVALADVPAELIACTLAAEDKRFFAHHGVDFLAICRAARDWVSRRHVTSGASTITQQLIKISSPPQPRSLWVKLIEALAARRLEMTWSKERILHAYLNRLEYGNLRVGPAEATRYYFQKPLGDLSLAECALLAGLPQAPSRLNPARHPVAALARRNTVLTRLAAAGTCTASNLATALVEPLTLRPLKESLTAPWLTAQAQLQLANPRIPTTLDLGLQHAIATIVSEETAKLKSANLRHAAVVVIHNPSGEILALVSSANWDDPRGGQLNGTLLPRSPGSTLKPFTYLLALDRERLTPASIVADIPTPFRTPQGLDLPENYDRAYRGPVTLRTALACSLNVPALRQLNAIGGPAPLFELLTQLGVAIPGDDPYTYGLGLTLGNAPVSLLDLTNAYATLARGGLRLPPRLFCDAPAGTGPVRVLDPLHVYLISHILADATARAPAFQSGGPLELPFPCAVKTGTSSDFHDNWCLGYTPQFTVGVWAGNFENRPMKGISGVTGAAPIFHRAMLALYQQRQPDTFNRPPGLVDITIDARNGKLLADTEFPNNPHARRDLAPAGRIPPAATPADYDVSGKALLDPTYAGWFASRHNLRRGELALDPAPTTLEPLRIITPADHTTFLLDPEIPSGSERLRPITNLPGTARWQCPTLRIEPASPEPIIHLSPGTHILTATDPRNGSAHTLTLHVKAL